MDRALEQRLKDELLRNMARLSFAAAAIYPILFFIVYLSTSIDFSVYALCGFFVVLPAGVGRVLIAKKVLAAVDSSGTARWNTLFWITVLASAAGWSLFSASTIQQEGSTTWNAMFLLLISTGLAAGGASSLAPDYRLAWTFILTLWSSHIFVFVSLGDLPTATVITLYCLYLSVQVKRQNQQMVSSIVDRAQLELQTLELKVANKKAVQARETAETALVLAEQARVAAEDASQAKSRFLATISHEIRTPLHGVLGMNTLLLDSELGAEQREYAETIGQSGEALLALINEVLDFSKLEAGREELQTQDLLLPEILSQAGEIVRRAAHEKALSFDVAVDDSLDQRLHGDADHLRQVLLNLLMNAIKFTDVGGVRMDASSLGEKADRLWVEIRVSDTGIGIAPKDLPGLFEPFLQLNSSTTRTKGGSGLGLAISKRLVDLMGGSLSVESVVNEGSTFTLQIPLRPAQSEASSEEAPKLKRLQKNSDSQQRILVVEDNETNQKILERLLSRAGYQCSVVENGSRAVGITQEQEFHLILMDCHMPEMDGYDAAQAIIKNLGEKAPPIVAVTANASLEDRKRCRESGMVDFLGKPVRLHLLQKVLDTYLS